MYDEQGFLTRTSPNPLDHVEELLSDKNWSFSRMANNQLMVQVNGKSCSYRLFFIWQENLSALQFCCQYDVSISEINLPLAAGVLMDMNESLWIGHFEISRGINVPSFRQTSLFAGSEPGGFEKVADLVQFSLRQCEHYFPVFYMLSMPELADAQSLSLALMETAGEA